MRGKRGNFHTFRGDGSTRPKSHDEWICGLNSVIEAVRSGRRVHKVFLASSRREKIPQIEREMAARGIAVQRVDTGFFEERFHKGHQGIAAVVEPREYATLEDVLAAPSAKGELPFFLLLDGVEDPRNFGAILRVADAGGVHGVVIQSHRAVGLVPEAVKSSAGAAEYVPVVMVPNIKHGIAAMKDRGIVVMGAEAKASETVWDADLSVPLAVVVGSEGQGLRRTVKEHCDGVVRLPMKGMVNSLNVSVATGIIIFEAMRQRLAKSGTYED